MRKYITLAGCALLVILLFSAGLKSEDINSPPLVMEEEATDIEELARSAASRAEEAADALDAARENFLDESRKTARARERLIEFTQDAKRDLTGFLKRLDAERREFLAKIKKSEVERRGRERAARDTRLKTGTVNLYVLKEGVQASSFFDIISNQYERDVLELPVQLEHDPNYRLMIVLEGEAFEKKAATIVNNLYRGDKYICIKPSTLADARFGPAAKYKRWSPVSWDEPYPDGTRRLVIDGPDFINTVKQTWFVVKHEPKDRIVDLESGDSLLDWYRSGDASRVVTDTNRPSPPRPAPRPITPTIRRRPEAGPDLGQRVDRLECQVNSMQGNMTELRNDVEGIKETNKDVAGAIQELSTVIRSRTWVPPPPARK